MKEPTITITRDQFCEAFKKCCDYFNNTYLSMEVFYEKLADELGL